MKLFNHKRPVRDKQTGEIVGEKPAPCSRMTVATLGGQFGKDKHRRLVVTMADGDVIKIRPERSGLSRTESMTVFDMYRVMIRNKANKLLLEKARVAKLKKKERRESRAVARADAKLRATLREEREP